VNNELDELDAFLEGAVECLSPDGRLVVVSYHSLEDRAVKVFFRNASVGCGCPPDVPVCVCGRIPRLEVLTRRVVTPGAGEIAGNVRARSAKLRAARMLDAGGSQ
jgi:16S rRNA (cytosine1402-N4)-methyltransferase